MTEAERVRQAHLDKLAHLANRARTARTALDCAVDSAGQARLSWNFIGPAVGMTRQGARQKWGAA